MTDTPITRAERLAGRLSLLAVAALLLVCMLVAGGCRATKPKPDERANASFIAPPVKPDTAAAYVSPSQAPGFLSHIGTVFSTPAGVERRQARKLARASVPRKLGKGAVYAPHATQVAVGFKNRAAVVSADSGATVTAIEKVKAPLAIGAGATATQTNPTTGLSWWLLLIPGAWIAWRLYRATVPFA